jgi:hypothetical protein
MDTSVSCEVLRLQVKLKFKSRELNGVVPQASTIDMHIGYCIALQYTVYTHSSVMFKDVE